MFRLFSLLSLLSHREPEQGKHTTHTTPYPVLFSSTFTLSLHRARLLTALGNLALHSHLLCISFAMQLHQIWPTPHHLKRTKPHLVAHSRIGRGRSLTSSIHSSTIHPILTPISNKYILTTVCTPGTSGSVYPRASAVRNHTDEPSW